MIERQGLQQVFELERECLLVALDLRWNGVRVDQDQMAAVRRDFEGRRAAAISKVQDTRASRYR